MLPAKAAAWNDFFQSLMFLVFIDMLNDLVRYKNTDFYVNII